MVAQADIQIVSNEAGEPTAVIVPIAVWKQISSGRETAYHLKSGTMRQGIQTAVKGRTAAPPGNAPAGFHAECAKLAGDHLKVQFLKLAQTRYQSVDGQNRMVCAVSAPHNETGGAPYFWFSLSEKQLDFLEESGKAWICLGCGTVEKTILIRLPEIANKLAMMSVTNREDRHCWHIVVAKRMGRLILRLPGEEGGSDLTDFNIGSPTKDIS